MVASIKKKKQKIVSQKVIAKKETVSEYPFVAQRTCNHWQAPVVVGEYTIWASALFSIKKDAAIVPDYGVYMAQDWRKLTEGEPGAEYVKWPDMGAITKKRYLQLVDRVMETLRAGKSVEIGCIGAHGRTGTLIAGVLAKLEGLTAIEAIAAVRERHCKQAVESARQERMVYLLLGEKPPPLPPAVTLGPASASNLIRDIGAGTEVDWDWALNDRPVPSWQRALNTYAEGFKGNPPGYADRGGLPLTKVSDIPVISGRRYPWSREDDMREAGFELECARCGKLQHGCGCLCGQCGMGVYLCACWACDTCRTRVESCPCLDCGCLKGIVGRQ